MTVVALLVAVVAMLVNTAATLLEAAGSRRATSDRPLWRQPAYLVGLVLDALGWVLAVVALRYLPVITVQSVLTSSVALTALAAHRFRVRRMPRSQLVGVAGVVLALVLVAGATTGQRSEGTLPSAAAPVLLVVALALAAAGLPLARAGRPLVLAAAAGTAYGGAALGVRALHLSPDVRVDADLLGRPLVWAVVVFGVTGVLLVAAALRHGQPGPVVGVVSVTEVVLPGSAGLVLLGDAVRPGWTPVLVVGVLAVAASVALLSRSGSRVPSRAV
ncbi:hypothetical protein [uncultured Pseudokineococcus sp.]|uniref:hypothetical protein n=1 Tax=uncultured Pseudokineococcus sp. TaxID=1642928 RepID=UPI00262CF735|nr:hypothetical protein [uncultured Pseudokineococcus sp.]